MSAEGVVLEFAQFGDFDSFDVIRSPTSMAALADNALPAPIATGLKTMYYVDNTVTLGGTYYYKIRVWRGAEFQVSDEIMVVAISDVPFEKVVALLNFEEGLVDVTGKRTWTSTDANVVKVIDTDLMFGSKALSILGTTLGKYIYTEDSNDFWFGVEDFGIEASIRLASTDSFHTILSQRLDNANQESFSFYYFSGNLVFEYSSNPIGNAVTYASAPMPILTNTKYDVQCVRSGPDLILACNGVELLRHNIGSAVIYNSTQRVVCGQLNASLTGGYFNGYIDELRVTKGYAPPIKQKTQPFQII